MSLLEVNDINVYYGAIHAIKGISFSVDEGEVVTLIGANGAGKSTTLNTVAGLLRPRDAAQRPPVYGKTGREFFQYQKFFCISHIFSPKLLSLLF